MHTSYNHSVRLAPQIRRLRHIHSVFYRSPPGTVPCLGGYRFSLHKKRPNTSDSVSEGALFESSIERGTVHPYWERLGLEKYDFASCKSGYLILHGLEKAQNKPDVKEDETIGSEDPMISVVIQEFDLQLELLEFVAPNFQAFCTGIEHTWVQRSHKNRTNDAFTSESERGGTLYLECVDGIFRVRTMSTGETGKSITNMWLTRNMRQNHTSCIHFAEIKKQAVSVLQQHYTLCALREEIDLTRLELQGVLAQDSDVRCRQEKAWLLRTQVKTLTERLRSRREVRDKLRDENEAIRRENRELERECQGMEVSLQQRDSTLHELVASMEAPQQTYKTLQRLICAQQARLLGELIPTYAIELTPPSILQCPIPSDNNVLDASTSVFYGHVAHVVHLAANILNERLLYPIHLCGSSSTMMDGVTRVPLPLFVTRNADRSKVKGAIQALMQDVQQLVRCTNTRTRTNDSIVTTLLNLFINGPENDQRSV